MKFTYQLTITFQGHHYMWLFNEYEEFRRAFLIQYAEAKLPMDKSTAILIIKSGYELVLNHPA